MAETVCEICQPFPEGVFLNGLAHLSRLPIFYTPYLCSKVGQARDSGVLLEL